MESSEIWGEDAEECHSSESGWTKYIDYPEHQNGVVVVDDDDVSVDHDGDDGGDDDDNEQEHDGDYDDDGGHGSHAKHESDSDDSMASDASSGHPWGNSNDHGYGNGSYASFEKKAASWKTEDKGRTGKKKEQKQEGSRNIVAPNRAVLTHVQSAKVRTNSWFGKRK